MRQNTQFKKVYKYDSHHLDMVKGVALSLYILDSKKLNKEFKKF